MNRDRSPLSRASNDAEDIGTKVYVSNLPFEAKWQQVKDLFAQQVGEVVNFQLFKNEKGLSRGCGVMQFANSELARTAITKMDKYAWLGRKMYVKKSEDFDRDEFGRIISGPLARVDKSHVTNEFRILVSNLPLDLKWQDLKDIFRNQIGDVTHAKMFTDTSGRPRGVGILEFGTKELAKEAIRKMNRWDIRGQKIKVEPLDNEERDKHGYVIKKGGSTSGGGCPIGQTYGLTLDFLCSLGIDGPLHTKLHVTNLEFRVDEKKLRQVFMLAGQVVAVEVCRDSQGSSRGFGSIIYSHPLEAVQAISMLHNQPLYGRPLNVRFDREPDTDDCLTGSGAMPEGLSGVGMGLGPGGTALRQFPQIEPVSKPQLTVWEPNAFASSQQNVSDSGYNAMCSSNFSQMSNQGQNGQYNNFGNGGSGGNGLNSQGGVWSSGRGSSRYGSFGS